MLSAPSRHTGTSQSGQWCKQRSISDLPYQQGWCHLIEWEIRRNVSQIQAATVSVLAGHVMNLFIQYSYCTCASTRTVTAQGEPWTDQKIKMLLSYDNSIFRLSLSSSTVRRSYLFWNKVHTRPGNSSHKCSVCHHFNHVHTHTHESAGAEILYVSPLIH